MTILVPACVARLPVCLETEVDETHAYTRKAPNDDLPPSYA